VTGIACMCYYHVQKIVIIALHCGHMSHFPICIPKTVDVSSKTLKNLLLQTAVHQFSAFNLI